MRNLKANAIILIAYLVAGLGSFLIAIPPVFIAPVWLPAAVGLAAILMLGHRALPAIGIGAALLTLPYGLLKLDAGIGPAIGGSLGLAGAAMLQAVIAKRLVQPGSADDLSLETGGQLIRVIGLGAIVASFFGAVAATAWLLLGGFAPPEQEFLTTALRHWSGNAVAAAAVTPVIILLFAKSRVSARRKRNVGLVFTILCLIGAGLFTLSRMNANEGRRDAFNLRVTEDHIALQERLNSVRRRLESLEGFFAASESVSDEEFATFVGIAFDQFDSASSAHWLVVDDAGSDPRHARITSVDGLDFDTRRPIMVAPGRELVTDYYFDGLPALVHDLLATGMLTASPLNGDGDEAWVALAIAAFPDHDSPASLAERRTRLQGVALGTFHLEAILGEAFQHQGSVYDYQVSGIGEDGDTLWQFGAELANGELVTSRNLPIGGQLWRIDFVATNQFLASRQDWVSWAVIVVGMIFITLLNALALLSTARTDLVQRLVDAKTAETLALSRNLALILEHAADAIIGVDAEGRGVLINPAAADLLGWQSEELTGAVVHDLIHPVDLEGRSHSRADCPVVRKNRGRKQHSGIERFWRKDGSPFFAEYSTEYIRDADDTLLGGVTILRDITERMETDADRERFIEHLTRANEELERFAFVASHDLQEPLRLISNFTGLLSSRYGDNLDETARTYIGHTLDACVRMQALITDLLAYGRVNSDADMMKTDVDLDALVKSTLDILGPAAQAARGNIEIGPLPTVRGNPARLGQLLQNLIGNAVKFQPAGQDARIRISARDLGDAWEISVADNGIGIAAEYREQVFTPFKRLHSPDNYPGSGMGLAICRKIVESHDGVLTVADNNPVGSVFRFTLPHAAGDLGQSAGTDPDDRDQ